MMGVGSKWWSGGKNCRRPRSNLLS